MSPEQIGAIAAGVVAIIGALTGMFVQVAKLRAEVNGRLSQLLEQATAAAEKRGELRGRDFIHQMYAPTIDTAGRENIRSVDEPSTR